MGIKVKNKVVTETTTRKLGKYEFFCDKCKTIHTKTSYAIAQGAMNNRLIFTCDCGNIINL